MTMCGVPYLSQAQLQAITRDSDWIQTFTGRQFWPLRPRVEDVAIEDIAHALSNMCRYTGHVRTFYSVADHSVRASLMVPREDALWALLHDASEAYLVDLPRPLKRAAVFGELYRQFEAALMLVICEKFGLPPAPPASVGVADLVLLHTERRDLMGREAQPWRDPVEPLPEKIVPLSPKSAERLFLLRFQTLAQTGDE
jgi:hypothetical protein